MSTTGVRNVVRAGDQLALVPGEFIDALKQREIEGVVTQTNDQLSLGQRVGLSRGPFSGLVGQIVEMNTRDRLKILIDLFGRLTAMEVKATDLRVAQL